MRAAFVIPARDKIHGIEMCVNSVLAQTYSPMDLVFSDQGSTDGTREKIQKLCDSYDGPNKVHVLDCPDTEAKGMAGLNSHFNWLFKNVDADILIMGSADDFNDAKRAEKVMRKFEETDACMVNTAIQFMQEDGKSEFTAYPTQDQFVTPAEVINNLVGGSTAPAWRHDFLDRVGEIKSQIVSDVYLAYLATQDKGLYYIHDLLYCLVRWADENNTGLYGRQLAAKTEAKALQLRELVQYQLVTTFREIYNSCERLYPNWKGEDRQLLYNYALGASFEWSAIRDEMNQKRIQPDLLKS